MFLVQDHALLGLIERSLLVILLRQSCHDRTASALWAHRPFGLMASCPAVMTVHVTWWSPLHMHVVVHIVFRKSFQGATCMFCKRMLHPTASFSHVLLWVPPAAASPAIPPSQPRCTCGTNYSLTSFERLHLVSGASVVILDAYRKDHNFVPYVSWT